MSDTLEITKANAVKAYKSASKELKEVLCNMFGKHIFEPGKITDRVKTFEDACREAAEDIDAFHRSCAGLPKDEVAYRMIKIIRKALNEGWTPDWNDGNQAKWYPYFDMRTSSGFGFSVSGYVDWSTRTIAGSRLCFKSRELAEYAGTQFLAIYKDYMTE